MILIDKLQEALARAGDTHNIEDVKAALLSGQAQLWYDGGKGAVITEIVEYPRKKICQVWLGVGELDTVLAFEPRILAFAREQGCNELRMLGRRGWAKPLTATNWTTELTEFRKILPAVEE
jgi:hypothetical protein